MNEKNTNLREKIQKFYIEQGIIIPVQSAMVYIAVDKAHLGLAIGTGGNLAKMLGEELGTFVKVVSEEEFHELKSRRKEGNSGPNKPEVKTPEKPTPGVKTESVESISRGIEELKDPWAKKLFSESNSSELNIFDGGE